MPENDNFSPTDTKNNFSVDYTGSTQYTLTGEQHKKGKNLCGIKTHMKTINGVKE